VTAPTQIGKYDIIRRLGRGGMGTVYLGRDPDLDRHVAIKVLREQMLEEEPLQRFLREARAAANLRHENIITIYDVGQHDHQPYMAMEYVDGTSLSAVIKERMALPLAQKLSYIEQICAGLHHAHGVGIVHRDIKPANLMVDRDGVVRVLDFGIARVEGSGITTDGALIGTLSYMSPEQMLGTPVDYRSDIFSVGAVAYELLAYQQAFPGTVSDGLLHRLPHEDPPSLSGLCPGLPPQLEGLIFRALAKKPHERFGDLDEMRLAIRDVRSSVDPRVEVETILVPSRGKSSRRSTSASAPSAERRELLERRARQIAVHRDAARAAFERQDLDGAIAACEDALTLDPDDREASQLLEEIQEAQRQREQESRVRRDGERIIRQRIVDAELRLSKGDVAAAVRLVQQVLAEEPSHAGALALLERIHESSATPTVRLADSSVHAANLAVAEAVRRPPATIVDARRTPRDETTPPRSVTSGEATQQQTRRWVVFAAACVALAAASVGSVAWFSRSPDSTSSPSPVRVPEAVVTTADPSPPAAPTPLPAPIVDTLAEPAKTGSSTTSGATPKIDDSLRVSLDRITAAYRQGDLRNALVQIDRVTPSDDRRVGMLAQTVAQAAYRSMDAALAAATSAKAADLAPAPFAAAENARRLADQALRRNDHVHAGTQALVAADEYRRAEADARRAASTPSVVTAPPASVPSSTVAVAPQPVTGLPPSESLPPPVAAPAVARTTAAAPPPAPEPAPAIVRPPAVDVERAGMLRALNRYQAAYRERSVKALQAVYPSLDRDVRQALDKQFKACRDFDVTFGNMQLALSSDDPSSATVTVRTVYTCQPDTKQAAQPQAVQDVFVLRKVGDEWLIDSMGLMGTPKRR
jgi:eukaryotic-like serine/threonine-protein kinase